MIVGGRGIKFLVKFSRDFLPQKLLQYNIFMNIVFDKDILSLIVEIEMGSKCFHLYIY